MLLDNTGKVYAPAIGTYAFVDWAPGPGVLWTTYETLTNSLATYRKTNEVRIRYEALLSDLAHLTDSDVVSLATGGKLPANPPSYLNLESWERAIVGATLTPLSQRDPQHVPEGYREG
jgi:hypothetical protein